MDQNINELFEKLPNGYGIVRDWDLGYTVYVGDTHYHTEEKDIRKILEEIFERIE